MTVQELHIDFRIKAEQFTSAALGGLSTGEIDWMLEQQQYEFIQEIINPKSNGKNDGFAQTRNRLDEVETLIKSVELPVQQFDANVLYAILPADHYHTIHVGARVGTKCDDTGLTWVDNSVQYAVMPLPTTVISSGWVVNYLLSDLSTGVLFDAATAGYFALGGDSELNYRYIDLVLNHPLPIGFSVYWERYGTVYAPNSFVYVFSSSSDNLTSIDFVLNGGAPVVKLSFFTQERKPVYQLPTEIVDARVVDNEFELRQNANPFAKSVRERPNCHFSTGRILLRYTGFAVTKIVLTYIRKPRQVNYEMSQSIELGSTPARKKDICSRIVDLCVARLAGLITSPATPILEAKNVQLS